MWKLRKLKIIQKVVILQSMHCEQEWEAARGGDSGGRVYDDDEHVTRGRERRRSAEAICEAITAAVIVNRVEHKVTTKSIYESKLEVL